MTKILTDFLCKNNQRICFTLQAPAQGPVQPLPRHLGPDQLGHGLGDRTEALLRLGGHSRVPARTDPRPRPQQASGRQSGHAADAPTLQRLR